MNADTSTKTKLKLLNSLMRISILKGIKKLVLLALIQSPTVIAKASSWFG